MMKLLTRTLLMSVLVLGALACSSTSVDGGRDASSDATASSCASLGGECTEVSHCVPLVGHLSADGQCGGNAATVCCIEGPYSCGGNEDFQCCDDSGSTATAFRPVCRDGQLVCAASTARKIALGATCEGPMEAGTD